MYYIMNNDKKKLVLLHWIGRFGNRMFQYAFGCSYAKLYNCTFYVPSEWEGDIIFKPNKYCKIIPDEVLCSDINKDSATDEIRKKALLDYNIRTGDNVELVSFDNKIHIGKVNIAFDDLHSMYFKHCFDVIDPDFIKEIYTFNDAVLNSEMYKWFYSNKFKHDVVHLRKGDIADLNYKGAHSMISKDSYIKQLDILGIDKSSVVWLSESKTDRTYNIWNDRSSGHRWTYPRGEIYCPDIFLDFLPDLLSMIFSRILLRGNSSLSWWGAFLSEAEVYSPVITSKPKERANKYYCMDTYFVKGNCPHFMGSKEESGFFNDIIIKPGNSVISKYYRHKQNYLKYVNFINIQPIKNKKIISFSLYGTTSEFSNARGFYKGIYVNYHLAKTIYPGWIIRIYMPYNEPAHIIEELSKFTDIELILVDTNICLRALRFLPYDDENVDIWLSRDLDSILNEREKVAVDDWLMTYPDKELHIMTDNLNHYWTIAGGMFGFKNLIKNAINKKLINKCKKQQIDIKEMKDTKLVLLDFILQFSETASNNNTYAIDCEICEKFFYKNDNYIQHYGAGKKLEQSASFPPHKPIDYDFVGCVVDIKGYYGKLNIEQHYTVLVKNKNIEIKNDDLFYYPPWNTNCIVRWYNNTDFTLTPIKTEKSTSGVDSCLKTENGDGVKVLTSCTFISALWDGHIHKDVYVSDENTIAVIHGTDHYFFTRV